MPENFPARSEAAKLNPIISTTSADTLTQCALMINELGHLMSSKELDGCDRITYLFTSVISAAILFEVEAAHV